VTSVSHLSAFWIFECSDGRRGWPAGQLPVAQPISGARTTRINGNMVLINSGFHTWKSFYENYP